MGGEEWEERKRGSLVGPAMSTTNYHQAFQLAFPRYSHSKLKIKIIIPSHLCLVFLHLILNNHIQKEGISEFTKILTIPIPSLLFWDKFSLFITVWLWACYCTVWASWLLTTGVCHRILCLVVLPKKEQRGLSGRVFA